MEAISCSAPPSSHWADLPADLVRDVSGRLHDAPNLARFRAVCHSWRDADLSRPTTVLLPSLHKRHHILVQRYHLDFRCADSSAEEEPSLHRRYGILDVPFRHDLFAAADGTAVFFLKVGLLRVKLIDHTTGAVTRLPRLPRVASWIAHPRPSVLSQGIVYGDGTIFLYSIWYNYYSAVERDLFMAAILRPGDARWVVVEKSLQLNWPMVGMHNLCAAFHDGNVVLCIGPTHSSYVMTIDGGGCCVVTTSPPYPMEFMSIDVYDPCYILEYSGQLLWVKVKYEIGTIDRVEACPSAMSVVVHALEPAPEAGKMRWVRKDGRSLGDLVLFLGSSYSFAMDAAQLGIAGGCAYLVFNWMANSSSRSGSRLMRCNIVDGESTCVKLLLSSSGKRGQASMWLLPQLAVAPIQDIRDRRQAQNKKLFHYKARLRRRVNYLSKFMGIFTKCFKF